MKTVAIAVLMGALSSSAAHGQSAGRLYAGATLSAQYVSADDVDSGGISSAGAAVGFRLTPAFSIEVEANAGGGELTRVYSGWFVSFAGPGASREEIERLAPTMQSNTSWTPGFGWSVLGMWRSTHPGRVGAAIFGGITSTRYSERRTLTVLDIPAAVDVTEADLHRMMPDSQVSRSRGGLTGGVLVPIRLTQHLSVAPEVRYTYGSFGDEIYTTFRGGVRLMWGF
jgi:hypothetical protein